MRQDCYYPRRTFIETITKRWENNFDRYDKHIFTFDWISWTLDWI